MDCDQFPKALGERIRAARKAVRLSQEQLAERANLHPTYVSDIERGKVNASITTYCQVAKALDMPLAEFLSLPEVPSDIRVSNELAALYARIRILNAKKQDAFFEAARNILSSIEDL